MDGVCADCWGSKGGRPMGWKKQPPGSGADSGWGWVAGAIPDPAGCLPWAVSVVVAALAVAWALLT